MTNSQDPVPSGETSVKKTRDDEKAALRRHVRDLTALLELPALWNGRQSGDIAESLLDVMVRMLRLDVAYLRLDDPDGDPAIESWRPRTLDSLGDLLRAPAVSATFGGMPTSVTVPLSDGDHVVRVIALSPGLTGESGIVVAGTSRADFPSELEKSLLQAAIAQAMTAIQSARLLAREQKARVELETIHRVGQVLASELDLEKLVQAVTDAATELSGAHYGSFFYNVTGERGETYALYTLSGAPRDAFLNTPMPRNTPLFEPTFRGEGIVRLADVRQDPRFGQNPPYYGLSPGHLPVVSYLAVPVVTRAGEVLGGLFFGHPEPGVFTMRSERIVAGLAGQAAIAMDNARLYREARYAVRVRDEFLAAVAHDLRTPLTTLKGYAQLLRLRMSKLGIPPDDRVIAVLTQIERTSTKMTAMIGELLDVARIQLGRPLDLDLQSTDLVVLAQQVVAEQQQTTDRHRIRLEGGPGDLVGQWDVTRLERVLDNLLGNAIKYSPDGGEIVVALARQDDATGTWAVLSVRDQGIGVPAADLPRIFERFQRGSNVTGRMSGAGLGLAGVRQIVELHGGRVTVESQEGAGSTFTIRLPITPSPGVPTDNPV